MTVQIYQRLRWPTLCAMYGIEIAGLYVYSRTHNTTSTLREMYRRPFWDLVTMFAYWCIGRNEVYENLFTAVQHQSDSEAAASFRHYPQGPTLKVTCCTFKPIYKFQVQALKKDSSGWHSIPTTAYCLRDCKVDISPYINECIPFALDEVCESESHVYVFFRIARVFQEVRHLYPSFGLTLTASESPCTRLSRTLYLSTPTFHWVAIPWRWNSGYENHR